MISTDSHPDAFPNSLTPTDSTMHLVDAGHAINTGFAPVLRPERGADVVISISNSWDGDKVLDVSDSDLSRAVMAACFMSVCLVWECSGHCKVKVVHLKQHTWS